MIQLKRSEDTARKGQMIQLKKVRGYSQKKSDDTAKKDQRIQLEDKRYSYIEEVTYYS